MASRSWITIASSTPTSSIARIPIALEPDYKHPACLYACRYGGSDAQLGHALLLARTGFARRAHRAHPAAD
jgi:hypothetical protein